MRYAVEKVCSMFCPQLSCLCLEADEMHTPFLASPDLTASADGLNFEPDLLQVTCCHMGPAASVWDPANAPHSLSSPEATKASTGAKTLSTQPPTSLMIWAWLTFLHVLLLALAVPAESDPLKYRIKRNRPPVQVVLRGEKAL